MSERIRPYIAELIKVFLAEDQDTSLTEDQLAVRTGSSVSEITEGLSPLIQKGIVAEKQGAVKEYYLYIDSLYKP